MNFKKLQKTKLQKKKKFRACADPIALAQKCLTPSRLKIWVYLGVKSCEVSLCFVAIVRVRVYYLDFFVFFVLLHW